MRVVKVERIGPAGGSRFYVARGMEEAVFFVAEEIRTSFEADEIGEGLELTIDEMSKEAVEALPDFDGWD